MAAAPPPPPPPPGIVICGAGVIGASIAYYLSTLGVPCVVLDKSGVAAAASGKAGGFLARDWCDGSPTRALARPSFDMHAALSTALGADTGYRAVEAYSASLASRAPRRGAAGPPGPSGDRLWLDGGGVDVLDTRRIASRASAAQVHPRLLTEGLLAAARRAVGTDVVITAAVGVERDGARVTGVATSTRGVLPCAQLVLAMGPWTTADACAWFPALPPIVASRATSIVLGAALPAQAVFAEYVDAAGVPRSPEAYPRRDEVYICGGAAQGPLPADPAAVEPRPEDVAVLEAFARASSAALADAPVTARQSCFLPVSPDGIPVIGAIPGTGGTAFVAAGHGCWGVLNSPATGLGVAELLVHGEATSVDLQPFAPSRFGRASRAPRRRR
jgi:glycine/D-amino acid oxidase-like deaminating enzyme